MNCLVYLPHSYTGRGPAESCVQIIQHFEASGLRTTLVVARAKKKVPSPVKVRQALPAIANLSPWRLVSDLALSRVERLYRKSLAEMEPGIAYFWPTASAELVEFAKHNGWVTVREMTNRTMAAAKLTLDEAFATAGEERPHHISQARVDEELAVLPTFDFVFSSNEDVDRSLLSAGVEESRILKSTFGWAERRFGSQSSEVTNKGSLTVGYLGMISIGKGVKDLIDGWKAWPDNGKLRLAGPLDWSMEDDVKALVASDPRVELHGYVEDIEAFYRSCDVLVVPTLDEGGPQVTYEMGAVGAAIIATPMAKARMLVDGRNALIVAEHSPTAIREALSRLATDVELRSQIGRQAKLDVQKFSYAHVGKERAEMLLNRVKVLRSAASVSSQSR